MESVRTFGAFLLIVICLFGCAPEEKAPAGPATSEARLRLYVFDCGALEVDDVSMFDLTLEEAGTTELFVPCYLIDHPKGRLLWDLGLPLSVMTGEFALDEGSATLERSVEDQLTEIELTKGDIDFVALSHLHFDHCGQAPVFADRKQLIQRLEYEAAFAEPQTVPFYDRQWYEALENADRTLLDGEHDVFGDGRVVIKPAPGHTPGHQILFLELEETGPLVLSGDLYHYPANRSLRRPPKFNVDPAQTLVSMDATEAFLKETGATLWIEHDAKLAATLRKSPEFYE